MKKCTLLLVVVFLFSGLCFARSNYSKSTTTDGNGKVIKTTTKFGNTKTIRDGNGRITRTVTKSGKTTITRDGSGKIIRKTTKQY